MLIVFVRSALMEIVMSDLAAESLDKQSGPDC